jgi:cell division protein FtsB
LVTLKRLVVPAVFGLALYFALFGGEYSLLELRAIRAGAREDAAKLDDLKSRIDSLSAWADSLESDSVALERLARERYGMIRDGEVLYRFADPDSTVADSVPAGDSH